MTITLVPVQLFGGAIASRVPASYVDASDFREVPDNQEVFVDSSRDESIIVDLCEVVDNDDSSVETTAAGIHFLELASLQDADAEIQQVLSLQPQDIPLLSQHASLMQLVLGTLKVQKFHDRASNVVHVHLAVVRLPRVGTDLVVHLNHPLYIDPESSSHARVQAAGGKIGSEGECELFFSEFVKSLQIHDWGLFG